MGATSAQLIQSLKHFSSTTRLYELTIGHDNAIDMLVEAFSAEDAIQEIGVRKVIALSKNAFIDLTTLLDQSATLAISLADGSRTQFSGFIHEASLLSCDGGFARYLLHIAPWMWRLEQVRNCRVWENKTVIELIDDVFRPYQPQARWRWSSETPTFVHDAVAGSYCCQYRESDFDFIRRILTEEGLCWRFEQDEDGPCCVIFSDSTQRCAVPEDPCSAQDGGIRFHGARPGESQDTVQEMHYTRSMMSTVVTVLSTDYKFRSAVTASSPARFGNGSSSQPLEVFDHPGAYAYADAFQARRYADLHMETLEARAVIWRGRSTVRTLRAGTRMVVTGLPYKRLGTAPGFTITRVSSLGINNLPASARQALAALFEPLDEWLDEIVPPGDPEMLALTRAQAAESGYANYFEAIPVERPWRAQLPDAEAGLHATPTAHGSQTAIVVGPDGSSVPNGAREIYCDRLGRVRIRFYWQEESASCWVRVAQRAAGGIGSQFLPRIGQEVFVQFMENNIDRPVIVGALYNGQGEGGIASTPGGALAQPGLPGLFQRSTDHAFVAQGNLMGTSSPVWHGASPDGGGHNNAAAQWGIRSKEFGGSGYNQLLFDDTDEQGRIQLKCSCAATELNLGHLIHAADNYRGSFRGLGAELRTDAYGAVRAGAGLLITSYTIRHTERSREPAGENAAGIAMVRQAAQLAEKLHEAAVTHLTVGLATQAPLQEMLAAVSGIVDHHGALATPGGPGAIRLPHLAQPIVAIAAEAGLGFIAGQDLQLAVGEAIGLFSGGDTQFATGGQLRVHAGEAIGMLGGAIGPGQDGLGVQLIAAQDAIELQAQADTLTIQARDEVNVISANAHIDWAAAESISLSTAGGANITISGGNITVQCPGKLTVHAGVKTFDGPAKTSYKLPVLPTSTVEPVVASTLTSTFAFDQLTLVAKNFTKLEFVMMLVPIFGYDIPATTYIKLHEALRNGAIAQPALTLMTGGHYPASFNNKTREILVHQAAADRAATGHDESWELLTALMHEFGHYIDRVLRTDLADKNPDGSSTLAPDAPGDEGAAFAYGIAFFDFGNTSDATYAQYQSPKFKGPLKVNYNAARKAIRESQDEEAQKKEGKQGDVEYFGAGLGDHHDKRPTESFGHQSIEKSLRRSSNRFNNDDVMKQIYFGNWLRDYSQILDPAIVRKEWEPKSFPKSISRTTLIEFVDLLAELHFVERSSEAKTFKVTKPLLGVYRPVEHIDNPKNNAPTTFDPQSIDKDFQPKAPQEYFFVDSRSAMKRYIHYSIDFMQDEICKAVNAGPNADGFRHFGAALHVLEDYFVHSNFVELSLRKLGRRNVLPWTSPHQCEKKEFPVITGMFDSDDVIASTAGLIADTLFKVQWDFKPSKPGERSNSERAMKILLRDHSDPNVLKAFEEGLLIRDKMMSIPGHQVLERAQHYTIGMVGNIYNSVYSALIQLVGNSVDDLQTVRVGNPNLEKSPDATHSQVAKDHDTHHFHVLAATLAQEAVRQVGKAMAARWWDNDKDVNPATIAATFIAHPDDTAWQDILVKQWASGHAQQIKRGESITEWQAFEKAHKREAIGAINSIKNRSNKIWNYLQTNYEILIENKTQVRK